MFVDQRSRWMRFGVASAVILLSLGYLAWTGVEQSKSYYVTIGELHTMGDKVYSRRLRVAGNVVAGSIRRSGTKVDFTLKEKDNLLPVTYTGTEAPPDTFHDDSQALAEGTLSRDGVFRANELQAKCASKYAPAPGSPTGAGSARAGAEQNGSGATQTASMSGESSSK
jgi:cytochrome c-type biogenesis protein CcmE